MVIGMAAEFKEYNISVNAVWPKTLLATADVQNLLGGDKAINHSRHPRIVADAVYYLAQKSLDDSGKFYLDEELIIESGEDLAQYNVVLGSHLIDDIYVE